MISQKQKHKRVEYPAQGGKDMLKSHEKFHSANGKRLVLVVDDEAINRELMGLILESDYELIYAENGQVALEKIRQYRDVLSLVLLDLMMPVVPGKEVLRQIKADTAIRHIPVIVLTADQNAEVESLSLGATDFIPKPYPKAGVIQARVRRTIELSEDRQIIQSTERDVLTGLYNREYFYRYAEQFDQHHKELEMDAIVLNINHFHMINERFGTAYGDEVLRWIGERVREVVQDTGGIVCRREADTFMVYCPHGKDYKEILDNAAIGLTEEGTANNRVRLRMGVYAKADKTLDIERRFDRAKMAADTVRNSFTNPIGLYDSALHERELYSEQLIEDFHKAIEERQFKVYYQPKFDVRPEIPVLSSAEALVRWQHPTLGLISPGVFIPLFEENGLIQTLDHYVWRTAAAQIRDWRERLQFSVPVSVNVSRIDMYDPHLIEMLQQLMADNGLQAEDLLLEITESAYTQDSEQIIATVDRLRALGFQIEMDDFGTGYSSLNMISTLPIDALKLDMQFIRNAFKERKDTRMLEVIIDIADYLSVPVIAEGVENEEQLNALKAMGCDLVQGYYFSRPVPAEEYERFVLARREQGGVPQRVTAMGGVRAQRRRDGSGFGKIVYALSSGFESVYYVDIENDHYVEFSSEGKYEDLQIERSGADFFTDTQRNIGRVVFREDQDRVRLCLQKEALLAKLAGGQPFSITYRLVINGVPTYYTLKAVRANTHDNHHIVIGVNNIDDQIRQASSRSDNTNALDFNSLAKALTNDMESIYYVDVETDTYLEFVSDGSYGSLKLQISGEHFFDECRENAGRVIYVEDRDRVIAAMEKQTLLYTLQRRGTFTMDYRLLIDGKPLYYRMKVIPVGGQDRSHIIIGVSNIDAQITEDQKLEAERQSAATYSRIAQALAQDYFSIYYVNTDTDRFIEYSAYDAYSELGIEKSGDDFFNLSRKNIQRVGHPDDLPGFLEVFTKENLLHELEMNNTFTINYRLLFNGEPTYVSMKATRMGGESDHHIVIGVNNVDAQMRRENELALARERANRDSLTGVKSKHAYAEVESKLNAEIARGTAPAFAVAMCDVNGLKTVNDTLGHAAGDELLRSAAMIVCNIFDHSPVFRYGGDEFVALLRGRDYENREKLRDQLMRESRERAANGGVVVACGLSDYAPGQDTTVAEVFERADAIMYYNKEALKNGEHA